MKQPKPYEVRVWFKNYISLLIKYNEREITGFNPSGKGSDTYYIRTIENYRTRLTRYGHLLTIKLK